MNAVMVEHARVEAFAERIVDALNKGALTQMVSLGHRTGLFDVMASLAPSTSAEIANAASLQERYVREWLGAMAVGGVIDYDPTAKTYYLPREHAVCLSRQSPMENLAVLAQYIPLLGTVEDDIVECFKKGGGVPYTSFKRFHEVMAEDSGQSVIPALKDHILPLVPGLETQLECGIDVLDIGCGRGRIANHLARVYPKSRFCGFDISEEAINYANEEAAASGYANAVFKVHDAAVIAEREAFDLVIAFDAIHDQARPDIVLKNIHNVLRPCGTFLMQDIRAHSHVDGNFDHPIGTLLYTISCMHCMTVSLSANGMGLGAVWGEQTALRMLAEAGFRNVRIEKLAHDIQNQFYIMTKQS